MSRRLPSCISCFSTSIIRPCLYRSDLVVNLPAKSEGGLEVNPAYVEQRIHDALESGEVDEFELGYHRLELKRVLGKGAFGKVFLAEAFGIGDAPGTSLVAVKVLNGSFF